MALTAQQVEAARAKASHFAQAVATTGYTYDRDYGTRYSVSEVSAILDTAGPSLRLTSDDIESLTEPHGFSITKGTLLRIGTRLLKKPDLQESDAAKFAALVLLWGYASQSYGAYRVVGILSRTAEQLGRNTVASLRALEAGALAAAYQAWLGPDHIYALGESFLTKILYFLAKVLSPQCPMALIKDRITSERAATLFTIPNLRNRTLESYLCYIEAIEVCAQAAKLPTEKIEEVLFTAPPTAMLDFVSPAAAIQAGFVHAQALQSDLGPPVLVGSKYTEATPDDNGLYRIMLVSDGKPDCGGLAEMAYSHESRALLRGFYSGPRESIIRDANSAANACQLGTPTFVMTTGYGAVAATATINIYNVPGERAIQQRDYWRLYGQSIGGILPEGERVRKVAVVYYAVASKKPFRDGILSILRQLATGTSPALPYEIHACMYGATRLLANRWCSLCGIFNALANGNTHFLEQTRRDWMAAGRNVAPFFEWF